MQYDQIARKLPRVEVETAVKFISYRFNEAGRLEAHHVSGMTQQDCTRRPTG